MSIWLWVGFLAAVVALLTLDLGVFHRRAHAIGIREALAWTSVWIGLALTFNVVIYFLYEHELVGGGGLTGRQAALQFLTGYVIEESLSMDNLFVMALIFAYFRVPGKYQHRVLFWGILGVLVMRGMMIAAGTALIRRFDWVIYGFGILLIVAAIKMLITPHDKVDPEKSIVVRLARRLLPITPTFHEQRFFVRVDGELAMTPLFLVLMVIENTDLFFAIDSIPAIFAVTQDPFIVFTSNVFAILGLRSLYFVLAGMMDKFRYLKLSLTIVLAFVGVKMLLSHHYPIPTWISLLVICGVLAGGIGASLVVARRHGGVEPAGPATPGQADHVS